VRWKPDARFGERAGETGRSKAGTALRTGRRALARYGGVFWYRERRRREAVAGPVEYRPDEV
jgi:hypothetical protein